MHFILSTLKLGPAKKSDLLAVLKDVLPDVLTDQQKSRKLSNLLQKMKKNGIIDVRGIAINSEWYLLTKTKTIYFLVEDSQEFSRGFSQG